MIADAQRVGDDREGRVDRAARTEETPVDDVEIVQIMGFTVGVQSAGRPIFAEANRSYLMRHTRQRNSLADVQVTREQSLVALMAVNLTCGLLLHEFFELNDQPLVAFFIVRSVTENDFAGSV